MNKTIHQKVYFKASAHEIFEALMDEKKHASFTGSSAKIERKVGGVFSVWNGYATGQTQELISDKKIVQLWRAYDWPSGHFSTAIFKLQSHGKDTELIFEQKNVPSEQYNDIKQGWVDYYWKPLKEFLDN